MEGAPKSIEFPSTCGALDERSALYGVVEALPQETVKGVKGSQFGLRLTCESSDFWSNYPVTTRDALSPESVGKAKEGVRGYATKWGTLENRGATENSDSSTTHSSWYHRGVNNDTDLS